MDKINYDEIISKSLDDIDAMISKVSTQTENLEKSLGNPDPESNDVVQNPPQVGEEGAPEEGVEEEGAPEEGVEEEGTPEVDEDDVEKSLESELKGNENVRKALEVSEFLDELVKSLSNVINSHSEKLSKSVKSAEDSQELLAKSFQGLAKAQKAVLETQVSVSKSMQDVLARLDKIENQPLVRKSVSNVHVIDKDFKQASSQPVSKSEKLSKSQASDMLYSAYTGGNTAIQSDLLAFESTGNFNMLSIEAKKVLGME